MACLHPENLIPETWRDPALASAAGKKSAEARRKKKLLKECLQILMDQEITDKNGKTMTGAEAMSAKLFQKALNGDMKAFELIRDTAGQKPIDKVMIADVDEATINEVESIVNGTAPSADALTGTNKKTGETKTFDSVEDAADQLHIDKSNIYKCLKGKSKSAGGWIWKK